MAADADWCASALALTEALVLADRLTDDDGRARRPAPGAARPTGSGWPSCPSTPLCLDRAAALARTHRCASSTPSTSPPPTGCPARSRYVTFDDHQIPVALALGFDVVSA